MTDKRTEKRLALIIASYEYQDPDLRQLVAPAQDAEALARVLQDPAIGGFEVQTLLNEPAHTVTQAVEAFFTDRRRDDLLLLYFSGHGIKDEDGQLYFATAQTRRKLLRSTAVSANFVNDEMRRSRSRRQVLLLDCCYSGAFAKGMLAKAGTDIGTGERFEGRGRVVLTASDAMQYAFEEDRVEGEGARSVFTRVLVHGLETGEADLDRDGRISLDELYEYVHDRVTDETPQQRLGKWDFGVQGKIIIARSPAPPVAEVSLPGWITEVLASGAYPARLAAVGELAQLSQGQDQPLAAAARAELERLSREDENLTVRGAASGALDVAPVIAQVQEVARPPRPQRGPVPGWAWIVGGAVLLTLSLCTGVTLGPQLWKAAFAPTATPTGQPAVEPAPALGDTWPRPADGMVMVYVPAGEFRMGSDDDEVDYALQLCNEYYGDCERGQFEDEQPAHTVALDGFWIDQTEITIAQYALCVADGECRESYLVDNADYNRDDYPVVHVSWYDAAAYCEWTGARLPTEAEWEYAARGSQGFIYPWGDEFDCTGGNFRDDYTGCSDGYESTAPVGSYPDGASWCNALDMVGNVWEWVADRYGSYPSGRQVNPTGPSFARSRVLRGGSWYVAANFARCAYRGRDQPSHRNFNYGFRCARDSE